MKIRRYFNRHISEGLSSLPATMTSDSLDIVLNMKRMSAYLVPMRTASFRQASFPNTTTMLPTISVKTEGNGQHVKPIRSWAAAHPAQSHFGLSLSCRQLIRFLGRELPEEDQ